MRSHHVIGGGAIGCSTAYFLTRHPAYSKERHSITLLEATTVAGGASGKAGGCLASWATPDCLAQLSFDLHAKLAAEHDGAENWGYRRVVCLDCETNSTTFETTYDNDDHTLSPPDWIYPGRVKCSSKLGTTTDTAQVHPYLYTNYLLEKARESGVEVLIGSGTSINYSKDGKAVQSVDFEMTGASTVETLAADEIVLAVGPWTRRLLPKAQIAGARSHSIVLDVPSEDTGPEVLFFNRPASDFWFPKLEVYPRPDNTTYLCGPTDYRVPLPPTTGEVAVDKDSCELIRRAGDALSPVLKSRPILAEQACYRPVVTIEGRPRSVGPLFGPTTVKGLILAAGHDQWGIQNSAATGKIISELILDGRAISADISSLDPGNVV